MGSYRPSMDSNPLLVRPGLGTVKPTQFNNPPPDHCFGYNPPKDPEGAREGKATVIEGFAQRKKRTRFRLLLNYTAHSGEICVRGVFGWCETRVLHLRWQAHVGLRVTPTMRQSNAMHPALALGQRGVDKG